MDAGTLSVTVISAKELPRDTNLSFVVKVYDAKGKSIKKLTKQTAALRKTGAEPAWNETFNIRVEKGCTGCSVALRSRDEQKSLQNLLAISGSDEKLGKARISESHLREQGGQIDGWYPLLPKHASKGRAISPSKRAVPQGQVHVRVTFEPDPLAADKARTKLMKHFPELAKDESLIESFKCSYKESALKYQSGTLFMTDRHLYFYAKSFKLRIAYSDILAVRKAHSALVIPNALDLDTRDGRQHHLTNFVFRDQALALLETRLPSLSYLQPPESSGRSPQRTGPLSGAIDQRSMPQLFRTPSSMAVTPTASPKPNPAEQQQAGSALNRKSSGGSASRTSDATPTASPSGSTSGISGRTRSATTTPSNPIPMIQSPPPMLSDHSPRDGAPSATGGSMANLLPRSAGASELSKARKPRGHTRNKSDGEAIAAAEMRFRQEMGQALPPAPDGRESAEQRRLRDRLNEALVEEESRRKAEKQMKEEVSQTLREAVDRHATPAPSAPATPIASPAPSNPGTPALATPAPSSATLMPPPLVAHAASLPAVASSSSDLLNRHNKLREELLKQEEMRKLLWDQTIKEKSRSGEPGLRVSNQVPLPDFSPKRIARRVCVLFGLMTLASALFSSTVRCVSWADRLEGGALVAMLYVLVTPPLSQLAAHTSTNLASSLVASGKLDAKQAGFAGHAFVLLIELLMCRVTTLVAGLVVPGYSVAGIKAVVVATLLFRFLSFVADQIDDFVVAPMLG